MDVFADVAGDDDRDDASVVLADAGTLLSSRRVNGTAKALG